MRQESARVEHDATNCYDRIIPEHAMITSQQHGMTRIAGGLIILILHSFIHFIRVNTGPSERHFTYKKEKRYMGQDKAPDGVQIYGQEQMM